MPCLSVSSVSTASSSPVFRSPVIASEHYTFPPRSVAPAPAAKTALPRVSAQQESVYASSTSRSRSLESNALLSITAHAPYRAPIPPCSTPVSRTSIEVPSSQKAEADDAGRAESTLISAATKLAEEEQAAIDALDFFFASKESQRRATSPGALVEHCDRSLAMVPHRLSTVSSEASTNGDVPDIAAIARAQAERTMRVAEQAAQGRRRLTLVSPTIQQEQYLLTAPDILPPSTSRAVVPISYKKPFVARRRPSAPALSFVKARILPVVSEVQSPTTSIPTSRSRSRTYSAAPSGTTGFRRNSHST